MTPTRLLVAFMLLCSSLTLAQGDQEKSALSSSSLAAVSSAAQDAGAPSWNILSDAAKASVPQDPLARLETSQVPRFKKNDRGENSNVFFIPDPGKQGFVMSPDSSPGDGVCLKIRSYVVARDSKNSDSTHLVGYSTCQPAKKFQLRTAVESSFPKAEK